MKLTPVVPLIGRPPVVLIFVNYYLPGFRGGGPIRTIANLVACLGNEFDFRIVTMDRDLDDQSPYDSIKVDTWNQVGKAQVFYTSSMSRSLAGIARLMRVTPHDVLYLNSFFNTKFTLLPLLARKLRLAPYTPVVLAPRGEFSEAAFKLKSWKKIPFTRLIKWLGIYDDVIWHSSTNFELADIQRVMMVESSRIRIACNIAAAPEIVQTHNVQEVVEGQRKSIIFDGLRICFLSRIAPMKNLDFALKVLASVTAPVQFHIYGPKESAAYWDECEVLIRKLPPNVQVIYGGGVENSQVRSTIAKYDLFFVPSRGENFGHVFMESLSAGVPILVSDQTPWRNLAAQKLGWDIALDNIDGFVRAIENVATFNTDTRLEMRAHCIAFAHSKSEDKAALEMNRNLFLNLGHSEVILNT